MMQHKCSSAKLSVCRFTKSGFILFLVSIVFGLATWGDSIFYHKAASQKAARRDVIGKRCGPDRWETGRRDEAESTVVTSWTISAWQDAWISWGGGMRFCECLGGLRKQLSTMFILRADTCRFKMAF